MSAPTLAILQAEFKALGQRLSAFEVQSKASASFPVTVEYPDLNEGERFLSAVIRADGRKEITILLPGSFQGNWQASLDWAKSIGGDLPTRVEQALLYADMREEFEESYYWSNEAHETNDACAWTQLFGYGYQSYDRKGDYNRARAVRRLVIL